MALTKTTVHFDNIFGAPKISPEFIWNLRLLLQNKILRQFEFLFDQIELENFSRFIFESHQNGRNSRRNGQQFISILVSIQHLSKINGYSTNV